MVLSLTLRRDLPKWVNLHAVGVGDLPSHYALVAFGDRSRGDSEEFDDRLGHRLWLHVDRETTRLGVAKKVGSLDIQRCIVTVCPATAVAGSIFCVSGFSR